MSIYEQVKAAVTARQAAEHYGLTVTRNGMTCCPFHDDHNPSMKVDERYYCFGCGMTGDVIDFTAGLYGIGSYEAAQKLAVDFGIGSGRPSVVAQLRKPQRPMLTKFRQEEALCLSVLTEYERLLEKWKTEYAPQAPEEAPDDRFVEACQMYDYIVYLTDFLCAAELEQRVNAVDELMKEGKIAALKERLNRLTKERTKHGKGNYDLAI